MSALLRQRSKTFKAMASRTAISQQTISQRGQHGQQLIKDFPVRLADILPTDGVALLAGVSSDGRVITVAPRIKKVRHQAVA